MLWLQPIFLSLSLSLLSLSPFHILPQPVPQNLFSQSLLRARKGNKTGFKRLSSFVARLQTSMAWCISYPNPDPQQAHLHSEVRYCFQERLRSGVDKTEDYN